MGRYPIGKGRHTQSGFWAEGKNVFPTQTSRNKAQNKTVLSYNQTLTSPMAQTGYLDQIVKVYPVHPRVVVGQGGRHIHSEVLTTSWTLRGVGGEDEVVLSC